MSSLDTLIPVYPAPLRTVGARPLSPPGAFSPVTSGFTTDGSQLHPEFWAGARPAAGGNPGGQSRPEDALRASCHGGDSVHNQRCVNKSYLYTTHLN